MGQLPSSYPRNPPKVKVLSRISHPNVFSGWICLSMLRKRKYTEDVPHEAWSGAYTIASILLQLQSFLFSENVPQDEGYDKQNYIEFTNPLKLIDFTCRRCGHTGTKPCPPLSMKQDHDFICKEVKLADIWEKEQLKKKKVWYKASLREEAKRTWVEDQLKQNVKIFD